LKGTVSRTCRTISPRSKTFKRADGIGHWPESGNVSDDDADVARDLLVVSKEEKKHTTRQEGKACSLAMMSWPASPPGLRAAADLTGISLVGSILAFFFLPALFRVIASRFAGLLGKRGHEIMLHPHV
jgi:hypothetical protein